MSAKICSIPIKINMPEFFKAKCIKPLKGVYTRGKIYNIRVTCFIEDSIWDANAPKLFCTLNDKAEDSAILLGDLLTRFKMYPAVKKKKSLGSFFELVTR